jgi:hypothetical protein
VGPHATEIVREKYLEVDEMKQLLLPTVLQMLRDSQEEDVVDGWMVALLELLPLLDKATLVRAPPEATTSSTRACERAA